MIYSLYPGIVKVGDIPKFKKKFGEERKIFYLKHVEFD